MPVWSTAAVVIGVALGLGLVVAAVFHLVRRAKNFEARQAALLRALVDNLPIGVRLVDRDLRVAALNRTAYDLLGLPADRLKPGDPFEMFIRFTAKRGELGPGDVEALVRARMALAADPKPHRFERTRLNGRVLEIRRAPMPGGGFVSTFVDITDRKRAEEELRAAKDAADAATRAKSEFLAHMSHELRTPLNAILGFSEIMKNEMFGPVGSSRYREYAADIHDSSLHLLDLINDILDLSKAEAGKIELSESVFAIGEAIDASLRMVEVQARAAGVEVSAGSTGHLPPLRADERRIKQILLNLLSNAVKFTPTGGRVAVEAGADPADGFSIKVEDTGIGIAAADLPKAMAAFGQVDGTLARKYPGTGLGLPLTKALVELHGGRMKIESQEGAGTTVTVTLPSARICGGANV